MPKQEIFRWNEFVRSELFGMRFVKRFGRFLLAPGSALVVYGIVRFVTAKQQPGTADGEGGTGPFYLSVVQNACTVILLGVVVLTMSVYCLVWKKKSAGR